MRAVEGQALAALFRTRALERLEGSLERRINTVEAQMLRVHQTLFPEPEFDSGWVELAPHAGMALTPDDGLPIKKYDVLVKTGPDTFEAVAGTPRDGPVWQRPEAAGDGVIRSVLVYSMAHEAMQVRLQGWYAVGA